MTLELRDVVYNSRGSFARLPDLSPDLLPEYMVLVGTYWDSPQLRCTNESRRVPIVTSTIRIRIPLGPHKTAGHRPEIPCCVLGIGHKIMLSREVRRGQNRSSEVISLHSAESWCPISPATPSPRCPSTASVNCSHIDAMSDRTSNVSRRSSGLCAAHSHHHPYVRAPLAPVAVHLSMSSAYGPA